VLVQLVYKPRVKQFIPALHELPAFVRAARTLGATALPECDEEVRRLHDGVPRIGLLRRATGWLMFEPGEANDLAASFYEYVNLLFLFDVNAFVFAIETLGAQRDVMRRMFEAIGYLDVVQSVAVWRAELPGWTTPDFTEPRKALHVEGLVHPLLTDPIANDLDVRDTSVLITGSNMSGKTTFVRAMGVNAVLAQTVHTVCATAWRAPMLRVRTSIGRADSLIEGKSYYLTEVESVRELLRAKERGEQHLFLLDEIFRGTNTTERVATAYAVLSHLNRGDDLVLVATHDIELVALLGSSYASHHFREEIVDGALTFDYRIHAGPSSTRNAIRLLEFMEFPEQIVADANAMLDWQSQLPSFHMNLSRSLS
jgi:DNA mismatch repair ATPase MutS